MRLYDGYRQVFLVEGKQLLLIQEEGRRYIIDAECPHSTWPMQNAAISEGNIICSKHGWAFDLRSGHGANERAKGCSIGRYAIVYDTTTLGLML